ncbi:hypothetical protein M378DRAFT_191690 [Amanita muscaria Koide BX008]|uniref:Very-long-chain (3R)-3-hydroxyacyl-CoA dehydratase n=1 Tax=Amanita muscaria (strain Koide BX008) TaxID=946122 RepID=A0A0C2XEV2_AMAMK|nr:hypothetical protein M378DRAFT_191690 [Amanita muscaria Koide BX008]
MASAPKTRPASSPKAYLIAYNVFSTLSWFYLLIVTLRHVLFSPSPSLHARAVTTYAAVGRVVAFVQTTAVLEVVHVLLGWVRSPLATTAMQVSSRIILVWAIAEQFKSAQVFPLYATMILSWSVTEVIRYAFYACSLLSIESKLLTYLRYTTFYVLYPTGAGSEAFVIFASVPSWGTWSLWAFIRFAMFVIWWPGLYVMYTYMMAQRRKVLGGAKVKAKKTQ